MSRLEDVIGTWAPEPVETTCRLDPWPVGAFAALLDTPAPPARPGDPLPPLWQWFYFLDHVDQSGLGEDGHPRDGRFLPPFPDRRRMIAGGRFTQHRPLPVDHEVTRRSSLLSSQVKHGRSGEMAFVTVRHEFTLDGEVAVVEEQDVVYRQQRAGESRSITLDTPDDDPGPRSPWSITLDPDATTLFRFSALTYNAHRIHYDAAYASDVEGYPGPVTHGPLLALLLLELPRRHSPGSTVVGGEFRLTRPAFSGQRIRAEGTREQNGVGQGGVTASAGVPGAPPSITGTVALHD